MRQDPRVWGEIGREGGQEGFDPGRGCGSDPAGSLTKWGACPIVDVLGKQPDGTLLTEKKQNKE